MGDVAGPGVARALAELDPHVVEELLVRDVAGDLRVADPDLLQPAERPFLVHPLAEGGAVVERHPQLRIGDEHLEAAAVQVEVGDDLLVEQPDDVGARADHVPVVGERLLERAGAAEPVARLQDEHLVAGPGEVGGAGEPVVAAADDDDVPAPRGELTDRRRQPDPAEAIGDGVHDRAAEVGPGDAGDELVDAVLGRVERPGPGVRRGQAALHRLAGGPVLPVGEVPEVDGVGRVEAVARGDLGRERPGALDVRAVGGERGHQVRHDVVGMQADEQVGVADEVHDAAQLVLGEAGDRGAAAAAGQRHRLGRRDEVHRAAHPLPGQVEVVAARRRADPARARGGSSSSGSTPGSSRR